MKANWFKYAVVLVVLGLLAQDSQAQRRRRNREETGNNTSAPTQQNNNTSAPTNFNAYGNLPIEVDSSSAGSGTGGGKSMRRTMLLDLRTPF